MKIVSRYGSSRVLWEGECDNLRDELAAAIAAGANLSWANLSGANLSGANLSRANLSGANLSGAAGINTHLICSLLMLLDQPGPIRAYKIVLANGEGIYARQNGYSPIVYEVGRDYEVADANTDEHELCGAGIHVATLPWCMREWGPGRRILVVEFTAEDIACIPPTTDGKFRVRRCRVVGEKNLAEIGLVAAGQSETDGGQ